MNNNTASWNMKRSVLIGIQQKKALRHSGCRARVEGGVKQTHSTLAQARWTFIECTCESSAFLFYARFSCQRLALLKTWTMNAPCQTSSQRSLRQQSPRFCKMWIEPKTGRWCLLIWLSGVGTFEQLLYRW